MILPEFIFLVAPVTLAIIIVLAVIFFILLPLSSMTDNPFKLMKAVYVYLAALIGLILTTLGFYGILHHGLEVMLAESNEYMQEGVQFSWDALVTPIAQIVTGLYIMIPHWAIGLNLSWSHGKKKK